MTKKIVENLMENESKIIARIQNLFEELDFQISDIQGGPGNRGTDIMAIKSLENNKSYGVAIELKSNQNLNEALKYGIETLERVDSQTNFDKLLLVINKNSQIDNVDAELIKKYQLQQPTNIEIISLNNLENWVKDLNGILENKEENEVFVVISNFTKQLISLIAKKPNNLMHLEWRDLERTIHELFNEIGFKATLTPPSKDGGKDVILECEIEGIPKSYIVEIKHWRSQQKVGQKAIQEFTKVIINEKREKGLYLSTYGYTQNYYECLTKTERKLIGFGEKEKIVELCNTYEKIKNGLYLPMNSLEDLLFQNVK